MNTKPFYILLQDTLKSPLATPSDRQVELSILDSTKIQENPLSTEVIKNPPSEIEIINEEQSAITADINKKQETEIISEETVIKELSGILPYSLNTIKTSNKYDFSQISILGYNKGNNLREFSPSIFRNHILEVKNAEPVVLRKHEDGLTGAFLIILSLFAIVKVVYFKKFRQYFTSFFNLRFNIQMLREEKAVNEQVYSIMLLGSLFTTTTFLYQLFRHYTFEFVFFDSYFSAYFYFKVLLAVLAIFILKTLSAKISGFILKSPKLSSDYIVSVILFFNILNIFLFPVIIGIQYINHIPVQFFFVTGAILFFLTFIFMVQRLYVLGKSEPGTSPYYIFLYLCTLEILPSILLIKFLNDKIGFVS